MSPRRASLDFKKGDHVENCCGWVGMGLVTGGSGCIMVPNALRSSLILDPFIQSIFIETPLRSDFQHSISKFSPPNHAHQRMIFHAKQFTNLFYTKKPFHFSILLAGPPQEKATARPPPQWRNLENASRKNYVLIERRSQEESSRKSKKIYGRIIAPFASTFNLFKINGIHVSPRWSYKIREAHLIQRRMYSWYSLNE